MKVAICYICTGRYDIFWDGFFKSSETNFLPGIEKHYFVFTDSPKITNSDKITTIYETVREWPFPTLLRFKMFLGIKEKLQNYDYCFFLNSNLIISKVITPEEILPSPDEKLTCAIHIGYYNKEKKKFPYERNPKSLACINENEGEHYVFGGLIGARTSDFLEISHDLNLAIEKDLANGVIAVWHDESHFNRYIIGKKIRALPVKYMYPEQKTIPEIAKIIILNKNKLGGHDYLRGIPWPIRFKNKISKYIKRAFVKIFRNPD